MKKIASLEGVKTLNKVQQKSINGGKQCNSDRNCMFGEARFCNRLTGFCVTEPPY
jgi:hypothetical protein